MSVPPPRAELTHVRRPGTSSAHCGAYLDDDQPTVDSLAHASELASLGSRMQLCPKCLEALSRKPYQPT